MPLWLSNRTATHCCGHSNSLCPLQVDKYTYEVCPYGKASQKEGHSSTSLGTWSGLEENGTRMAFKNGQGCWQGPARSISVGGCLSSLHGWGTAG